MKTKNKTAKKDTFIKTNKNAAVEVVDKFFFHLCEN